MGWGWCLEVYIHLFILATSMFFMTDIRLVRKTSSSKRSCTYISFRTYLFSRVAKMFSHLLANCVGLFSAAHIEALVFVPG